MDDLLYDLEGPTPEERERRERRFRLASTVAVVGLSAFSLTNLATGALFTDTDSTTASVTTGNVDIATSGAAFSGTAGNMAPGDVVYAPITVDNSGSLQLRYTARAVLDAGGSALLATTGTDRLQAAIAGVPAVGDCDAAGFGTADYNPAVYASAAGEDWFGVGTRTLDAGTSEVLCVRLTLPLTADNSYANQSAPTTVYFDAVQTANN